LLCLPVGLQPLARWFVVVLLLAKVKKK
jgi:hypothetical protein